MFQSHHQLKCASVLDFSWLANPEALSPSWCLVGAQLTSTHLNSLFARLVSLIAQIHTKLPCELLLVHQATSQAKVKGPD